MSFKIIFMLAFLSVVFALPEPRKSRLVIPKKAVQGAVESSGQQQKEQQEHSDIISDRSNLVQGPKELNDAVESVPSRIKRACRSVQLRTKSGKVITINKC
ncbi:uncharacterized protein LOC129908718 [Episyrphus balteatus]|uniref:uncharacterized protein LOC129908718 n=1 Tax=Episyrphus balteatus TaxID=286459 RepID=UPI002484F3F9|nr:uncharacterized protein LOC129908718 [Episyrphus balteatus]